MSAPPPGQYIAQQHAQVIQQQQENPAIIELRTFLATAPRLWTSAEDPPVRKFKMANGEEISCVFWKGRFFITGTDVVKILIFRFQQLGRGILNPKKFEEGVFSDLRNLKPGTEAVLEEPRSEFLEFLHKHGCIRTQKKQKVFFWNKVPHDDLFREALERNLKRVTNVFNWTQMITSPDVMKQYMMIQAAALNSAVVGGGNPASPAINTHPAPSLHMNTLALPSPSSLTNNDLQPSYNTPSVEAMFSPKTPLIPYASPSAVVAAAAATNAIGNFGNTIDPRCFTQDESLSDAECVKAAGPANKSRRTSSMSTIELAKTMLPLHNDTSSPSSHDSPLISALDSPSMFSTTDQLAALGFDDNYFDLPLDSPTLAADPLAMSAADLSIGQQQQQPSSPLAAEPALSADGQHTSLSSRPADPHAFIQSQLGADLWLEKPSILYDHQNGSAQPPLWDDLSMLIPSIEPNHQQP